MGCLLRWSLVIYKNACSLTGCRGHSIFCRKVSQAPLLCGGQRFLVCWLVKRIQISDWSRTRSCNLDWLHNEYEDNDVIQLATKCWAAHNTLCLSWEIKLACTVLVQYRSPEENSGFDLSLGLPSCFFLILLTKPSPVWVACSVGVGGSTQTSAGLSRVIKLAWATLIWYQLPEEYSGLDFPSDFPSCFLLKWYFPSFSHVSCLLR